MNKKLGGHSSLNPVLSWVTLSRPPPTVLCCSFPASHCLSQVHEVPDLWMRIRTHERHLLGRRRGC